jgi:ABC-type nitrate/sulfonate/bicarbonate transport system permease component
MTSTPAPVILLADRRCRVRVAARGAARLRATIEPVLELFRAIPPPALVPVFMLLVGIGTAMKLLVIVSGAVWLILLNTIEGVRAVDEVLSDTCRCYGITGTRRLWVLVLVLRAASPQIVTGRRCRSRSSSW